MRSGITKLSILFFKQSDSFNKISVGMRQQLENMMKEKETNESVKGKRVNLARAVRGKCQEKGAQYKKKKKNNFDYRAEDKIYEPE